MSNQELQEEEKEVLASIYDCDECFKQTGDVSFTYRVGEAGEPKSFLVELTWSDSYPDELPTINLDAFYNKHLNSDSKASIMKALKEEGESLLGSPMTYSLFELAKERAEELIVDTAPESTPVQASKVEKKKKKEVLSKQQKRRLADKLNAQGERARGWNWVDVVKLSKTGKTGSQ